MKVEKNINNTFSVPICELIGILVGIVVAIATGNNIGIGIGLGLAIGFFVGMMIGFYISKLSKTKERRITKVQNNQESD
ncbi:MAG: hypothetical protein IJV50_09080 [Lachnospiraceae bacterium]|nr:hypothetical protein [Lachnospiraceae bacterium]